MISYQATLSNVNIPLHIISHMPRKTLPTRVISLLTDLKCTSFYGNIEYELDELRRDIAVCKLAEVRSIQATFVHNKCIIEPGVLLTGQRKAYAVRTRLSIAVFVPCDNLSRSFHRFIANG
jgi:deoxyribodipyrimidine photo-lyase